MLRSERFALDVVISTHARARMADRQIDEARLLDLIETGDIMRKEGGHVFIHKAYADRQDNLLCAAAVVEGVLVVKTVMVNWQIRGAR